MVKKGRKTAEGKGEKRKEKRRKETEKAGKKRRERNKRKGREEKKKKKEKGNKREIIKKRQDSFQRICLTTIPLSHRVFCVDGGTVVSQVQ